MAKRVRDNVPSLLWDGVASGDIFFIDDLDANVDSSIVASELKKYILGNHAIGGTSAGDIADISTAQTFTNKRLNAPGINSATPVTADSAEINKLDGCTATTANLNLTATYATEIAYLSGLTANVQAQIDAAVIPLTQRAFVYGLTFTADATTNKIIAEADILTALGISATLYGIDPTSMHGTLARLDGGTYSVIDDSETTPPTEAVQWTTQIDSGVTHVDELKISGLTNTNQYNVAFTFKVIEIPGV